MRFPVRMTHPDHGAMHVYDTASVEKAQKRGWSLEDKTVEVEKKRGRPKKVSA